MFVLLSTIIVLFPEHPHAAEDDLPDLPSLPGRGPRQEVVPRSKPAARQGTHHRGPAGQWPVLYNS